MTKNGFTLVELLVIIGILIILTAIAIPSFHYFRKRSDLENSTEEIINILRLAQNRTLASEGPGQYGVYFDDTSIPHQYTLFKGPSFEERDLSFDEIHKLPKNIEIYEINLGGENEVVFERLTGETFQVGNLILRLIDNPTKTKTVCVARYIIGFCGPPAHSGGLITSTRHVHFDLGWSIQDATTLKFDFTDVDQVETIDMADCFSEKHGETKFDWKGEFIVGGIKQKYHIHTHSLDAFDTLLGIHRDEKNTEPVTIYIVDAGVNKEIVRYLSDGTGILGYYGGTFEIQ